MLEENILWSMRAKTRCDIISFIQFSGRLEFAFGVPRIFKNDNTLKIY